MEDSRRCKAKLTNGKRRCRNAAILGGTVCEKHGGKAPQVRAKARERLASLVDPAIERLAILVNEEEDKKVALATAKDILDRNDMTGKTRHEVTGPDGGPIKITVEWGADE